MKIILKIYKEHQLGNFYTELIEIPNNKISVNSLKKILNDQLGFEPSFQRLTYKLYEKKIITLPNDFPLFYFNISDHSTIFLEIFKNCRYKHKKTTRSPVSMKYMNKLGYHFQYTKKCQSVTNLVKIESKSSVNSNSNSNNMPLSDDEIITSKNNKETYEDDNYEDYELVLNNKESIIKENDKNSSKMNQNEMEKLRDKLIKLILKKDFDKIKLFFAENKLSNKLEDINNIFNNNEDDIEMSAKNIHNYNLKEENNNNKEYNICEMLNNNGWNALHYLAYYGY